MPWVRELFSPTLQGYLQYILDKDAVAFRADMLDAYAGPGEQSPVSSAIFIIDGLDESFAQSTRDELSDWVRSFARSHPRACILAGSRDGVFCVGNWPREVLRANDGKWTVHTLFPFENPRISPTCRRWYDARTNAEVVDSDLALATSEPPAPHPLHDVPTTLTILRILGKDAISCDNRTDVFARAMSIFFRQWIDARGLPEDEALILHKFRDCGEKSCHLFLGKVALKMGEAGAPERSNRISRLDLRSILLSCFGYEASDHASKLADGMLRLIGERAFFLTRLATGDYAFIHRVFLEYYTALAWSEKFSSSGTGAHQSGKCPEDVFFEQIFRPRFHNDSWSDTFHFLIGMLQPTPARVCLQRLASLAGGDLAPYADNDRVSPHDHPFAAKVLAAELALNLQQDTDETGRSISAREVIQPWKDALLAYAWSEWDPTYVMSNEHNRRSNLRRRAQNSVASLWCGDQATIDALADRLLIPQEYLNFEYLGLDMAAVAPGRSQLYFLLLDIIYAPCRLDFPGSPLF